MLDLKLVAQNPDAVVERLLTRGGNLDFGDFRALVSQRSAAYVSLESLQAKRNAANEEMKRLAKQDPAALERLRGDLRTLSQEIKEQEKQRDALDERLSALLLTSGCSTSSARRRCPAAASSSTWGTWPGSSARWWPS